MLAQLPPEIICHIATFLSTASCLINLSLTCRHLHAIVSADDYRIFHAFVQSRFPSIDTPPFWKDAVRSLTSRSRAFDRKAIIARFVLPPQNSRRIGRPKTFRTDHPTLGYRPVIDSYEVWYGESWADRKEVLVWGAGADLIIRVKHFGSRVRKQALGELKSFCRSRMEVHKYEKPQNSTTWTVFNDLRGVDSWDDISGVHLLASDSNNEDIIFGRRNSRLVRMSISLDKEYHEIKKTYVTGGRSLERTDLSRGSQPVLAATLDSGAIALFKVNVEACTVQPFATLGTALHGSARARCSKLLDDDKIAIGSDGAVGIISTFRLAPDRITRMRDMQLDNVEDGSKGKMHVSAIEPLAATSRAGGSVGDLFLAGWEDSKTRCVLLYVSLYDDDSLISYLSANCFVLPSSRLHDLRSPKPYVSIFTDTVDDSTIYAILPIGHERFLVGSGTNAIVKIFDMRMPARCSYPDASVSTPQTHYTSRNYNHTGSNNQAPKSSLPSRRKDISMFLSQRAPNLSNRVPLFHEPHRYRGPVYAMSLPSPSSSSVYVGVENSVIRLDFASTDDLTGPHRAWYNLSLGLGLDPDGYFDHDSSLFDLSCYERPLPEDQGRGVRLMMQDPFWTALGYHDHSAQNPGRIPGWDSRWFQPWATKSHKLKGPWRIA